MSSSDRALADRVAVVTGAGSGLGRAIARRFATAGARLVCVDLDAAGNDETVAAVTGAGGTAVGVVADVSDVTAMEQVAAVAVDTHGTIDVLAANAGIPGAGTVLTTTPEQWDRVLRVNLTGVWASARAVLPAMVAQQRGSIVVTASQGGMVGVANIAAYAAAKGGAIALVRQVVADFSGEGIRVNALCPGTTPTPLVRASYATGGGVGVGDDVESRLASAATRYPLGRLGRPEDVAEAALFLASDASDWITGVALPVDGGFTAL